MIHSSLQKAVGLAALAALASAAAADFIVVYPAAADTYVETRFPESNNGDQFTVAVTEGYYKGSMYTVRGLLRFDFDLDVPADFVAQATLGLTFRGMHGDFAGIDEAHLALHAVVNDWKEYEATWRWGLHDNGGPVLWDAYMQGMPSYQPGGGDFDPQPAALFTVHRDDLSEYFTIDITDLVRDWQSGDRPNHGLLIKYHEEREEVGPGVDFQAVSFTSRESLVHPDDYPRLVVRLHIPGDLTNDNVVDQRDLALLLSSYHVDDGGDINGDGVTDHQDLVILLGNWGRTLP